VPDVALALGAALAEAAQRLEGAGVPDARREALRLWADPRAETPAEAWLQRERVVPPAELREFLARVGRRAGGEPLAYVTGSAGFRRLVLRSDRRALIPRPETEGLVDLLLERVPGGTVADIGTGSGCLALSLATEGTYDRVLAVDRSRAALELAAENRALVAGPASAAAHAVALLGGDLVEPLADASVDGLVSNPPYLTEAEWAALDPSVKAWEPREALASGADGLDAIRALLQNAARVLRPGGWIVLEVDSARAGRTADFARAAGWTEVTVGMDLYGRERYLLARRSEEP
jgi:release factor glutamine methyltransferase